MMQPIGAQGYYQQAAPSASAVNIQIFEPKAYGGGVQQPVTNPTYAYPQQSVYNQPYVNQYQQFMPQQVAPQVFAQPPVYQPIMQQPQVYQPMAQILPQQQMPAPIINQAIPQETPNVQVIQQGAAPQVPTQNEMPMPAQPAMQAPEQPLAEPVAAPNVNVVPPTEQNQTGIDVNALVTDLGSADNKVQEDAITKIANYSQGEPQMQTAVLTEPVMKGLVNIIKQDTSNLEGPSEAQKAAINKAATGAKLTPEEEALTTNLAPKTLADKNRVIAMYTLALLQKNQRDEIDRYNQTQEPSNKLPQLQITDLQGYNEIEGAARNENVKEVKLAAIQALAYVARPEDKQVLEPVLTAALQDEEPLIKQAATDVLTNIGSTKAGEAQPEQVDVSKMSKKERKAYEKAQKKAEKEAQKAAK